MRIALAVLIMGLSACSAPETPAPPVAPAQSSQPAAPPAPAMTPADPRFLAADLPLLPDGVVMAVRPVGVVRATYEFAARHPEVMKYVPCFCGCERGGHMDNHDCFVASRGVDDRVTQWESHAIGCEVCIDVANQALQMHNSGASVSAIRDAVEKKYAPLYQGHTPTQMPKRKGDPPSANTPR
jgi:hypothetical protein